MNQNEQTEDVVQQVIRGRYENDGQSLGWVTIEAIYPEDIEQIGPEWSPENRLAYRRKREAAKGEQGYSEVALFERTISHKRLPDPAEPVSKEAALIASMPGTGDCHTKGCPGSYDPWGKCPVCGSVD